MSDDLQQFVIDRYDLHVRATGGEVLIRDARTAIREDVMVRLANTPRDLDAETDRLIADVLGTTRNQRSASLKRNLDAILEGFCEDGVYVDPLLDLAFPLGRADGADKTLRRWTADDLREVTIARFRVAAESTASAAELDDTVQKLVASMAARGLTTLGGAS